MTDDAAVVAEGVYPDDTITLEGQEFIVSGSMVASPLSEFVTGLKIGLATYDEREHAFYLVLDDFSGGWGHRKLNIRESLGTHWDNDGGVDLRRARHITLPPKRNTVNPSANPAAVTFFSGQRSAISSDVGGTEYLVAGVGGAVYTLSADRVTLTKRQDLTDFNRINKLIDFTPQAAGSTRNVFAFGYGTAGRGYFYTAAPAGAWSQRTGRDINEAIVWDGQVIGVDGTTFVSSADPSLASNWDLDVVGATPHWIAGSFPFIVGVAMAPWGASAVYFIDQGKLFILDWYVYNAIQVHEVGDMNQLSMGCVWNDAIYLHDGRQIWEYIPGGTVRSLGPFSRDGAAPSWLDGNWSLGQFLPGTSHLFIMAHSTVGTAPTATFKSRLMVYNGSGWSWFGSEITSADAYTSVIDRFPLSPSLTVASRAIDIFALENQPGGSTPDNSTTLKLYSVVLPRSSDVPYIGSDAQFEDGPLAFRTGWIDGGFADIDGVLFRVNNDGFSITDTETVKVEYRLNNDETANFELLGTFKKNQDRLWFDTDHRGVQFRTVQFQVTLDRGSTATRTPELQSLVMVYNKKPNLRRAWSMRIDINAMVQNKVMVGAEPASFHSVFELLSQLWNTQPLLRLVVPSITDSQGYMVQIANMPATFDDWHAAVAAQGVVDLQLLEPVVDN